MIRLHVSNKERRFDDKNVYLRLVETTEGMIVLLAEDESYFAKTFNILANGRIRFLILFQRKIFSRLVSSSI